MNRIEKIKLLKERKEKDLKVIESKGPFNTKSKITKVEYRVCRDCKKIWHVSKFRPMKIGWPDTNDVRRNRCCRKCESEYQKKDKEKNPSGRLYKLAKIRARKNKLPFNITIEYIDSIWPKDNKCPITNREFKNGKNNKLNWATLDKVRNDKGYVIGNVAVISYEANALKADILDLSIFEKMSKFYKNFIKTSIVNESDSLNEENVMSRMELLRKNPKKYKEIYKRNY